MRGSLSTLLLTAILAVMPTGTLYKLNNYTFGNGGTSGSSGTLYSLNGTVGELTGGTTTGTLYKDKTGRNGIQDSAVPIVTITNPASYYNKLKIVIGAQNNPSDALFAVAISTDNFTTTNYVKSDNTVTASLSYPTDYRTYASWGSGTGLNVTGLTPSTTYYVKAKAIQGKYTETGYGPVSSVATVLPNLSFGLQTNLISSPPFNIGFGTLTIGAANAASDFGKITLDTNAELGGDVYLRGASGGLTSTRTGGVMSSVSGDLSSVPGYGAQGGSATQVSGGPFTIVGPNYNGASNVVGAITTTFQRIFTSAAPVTTGSANILFKARPTTTTPSSDDYTETITIVASGNF